MEVEVHVLTHQKAFRGTFDTRGLDGRRRKSRTLAFGALRLSVFPS